MKKPVFTGAAVAIVTPFLDENTINYDEFGKIIDHQIANGTDAIVVMGTTGESPTCPEDEHEAAISFCCEYVGGRVPVIAGAGSNDTRTAVKLTKSAKASGAGCSPVRHPVLQQVHSARPDRALQRDRGL